MNKVKALPSLVLCTRAVTTQIVQMVTTHKQGKLGVKEKAAFCFEHVFFYPFGAKTTEQALHPSGQPASFICSLQILKELCVELSAESNGEGVNEAKLILQYSRKSRALKVAQRTSRNIPIEKIFAINTQKWKFLKICKKK